MPLFGIHFILQREKDHHLIVCNYIVTGTHLVIKLFKKKSILVAYFCGIFTSSTFVRTNVACMYDVRKKGFMNISNQNTIL